MPKFAVIKTGGKQYKVAEGESAGPEKKKVATPRKTKKKVEKTIPQGCAFVQATYNNTIVSLTDKNVVEAL